MPQTTSVRAARLQALGIKQDPGGLTQEILRRVLTVPVAERYILTDHAGKDHVTGLYVRVGAARLGPKGKQVPGPAGFYAQRRVEGSVRQVKLGPVGVLELSEARDLARDELNRMRKGIDPNAEKRKRIEEKKTRAREEKARISLQTYIEGDYWKKRLQNARGGEEDKARLLSVWKDVLGARLDELTEDTLNEVLQTRRDAKKASATLLRDWGVLRAVLNQAGEDKVIPTIPFARRMPPALMEGKRTLQGKKRVRWLKDDELTGFKAALAEEAPDVQAVLRLLAITGMRRGDLVGVVRGKGKTKRELSGLKRSEVNVRDRVATIPAERSKNGKERHVRLNTEAVEILKALKVHDLQGCYFPGKIHGWRQRLKKAMSRIREAAELSDFHTHDLRHVFAVQLRRAGAALEVVRDALGHSDVRTTEIYAHVLPDEVQAAVERVRL